MLYLNLANVSPSRWNASAERSCRIHAIAKADIQMQSVRPSVQHSPRTQFALSKRGLLLTRHLHHRLSSTPSLSFPLSTLRATPSAPCSTALHIHPLPISLALLAFWVWKRHTFEGFVSGLYLQTSLACTSLSLVFSIVFFIQFL